MPKAFIDSNFFLRFYDRKHYSLEKLKELKSLGKSLVFPKQVVDEVKRNREGKLNELIAKIKNDQSAHSVSASLLDSLGRVRDYRESIDRHGKARGALIEELLAMKADPKKDPIFAAFDEIVSSSGAQIVEVSDPIYTKALKRKHLGNPPKSDKKDTIGDEIVWEALLASVREDLVLLSHDGTFKLHEQFLSEEFNKKTGARLTIEESYTDFFSKVGSKIDVKKMEEERKEIAKEDKCPRCKKGKMVAEQMPPGASIMIYWNYQCDACGYIGYASGLFPAACDD